ncbi:FAD-dependent oxidoreductase [Alkalibaculum sp. M08DMB]|uniref:FAD-dependent oxidoreductase n=1 Tax=Alkalibaculum sporogenes TaxID=2655001 RepID=A0A6A7KB59_9FIRM|nr:NAD(P)/FAD-dependent oxidoreductase [Alkalibaculum sporogenes]MPW26585.1 FAD-dependent oxidoreductase [Alkalibaculum sporogenes]
MSDSVAYEVIIIGGGAAGLSAGIYCGRSGLSTLILEENFVGGVANSSYHIGNYPGFPQGVSGIELMERFYQQACEAQVKVKFETVNKIYDKSDIKIVETNNSVYETYGIIIALGGKPKQIGAINEDMFIGKGISFCTTCDATETKNKNVIVVGTGDTAIDQSIYLSQFCNRVLIISLNPIGEFDCSDKEKLRFIKSDKIEILWNKEIYSFQGDVHLSKVIVKDVNTNVLNEITCEYCFEFIGFSPNSHICKEILELDNQGAIVTNDLMETSHRGIYAIGDVRSKALKQLTTATSDGAIAAFMIRKYINSIS